MGRYMALLEILILCRYGAAVGLQHTENRTTTLPLITNHATHLDLNVDLASIIGVPASKLHVSTYRSDQKLLVYLTMSSVSRFVG